MILLAVSVEKKHYYLNLRSRERMFFFNLGPLIKLIRSTSSNQTPPCHSARSLRSRRIYNPLFHDDGFRDFARNDNASTNRALNSII